MISIFASAIVTQSWGKIIDCLKNNNVFVNAFFCGHVEPSISDKRLNYIKSGYIKPAQCAQIAASRCDGELMFLTADDAVYEDGFFDKIWDKYIESGKGDVCISSSASERESLFKAEDYTMGDRSDSPVTFSFAAWKKSVFDKLGGLS